MTSTLTNMKRVTENFIEGFNTYSLDAIVGSRTPECLQYVQPMTLGRPPLSNEDYKQQMTTVWQSFTDWKFVADNIVYDTGARKVAFHATSKANSPIGLYRNEYAWFLQFNESGEKITQIQEFVDSLYITEFLAKVNEQGSPEVAQGSEK